jgi:hypothetical protein
MRDHTTGCVECDRMGAPVEGMTMRCRIDGCWDIICFGHVHLHEKRVHGVTE